MLDASQSTLHSDGKNRSSGVEAGVGFQVGAQTGVYIYAAANVGKGHNQNDTTINNNTALKADTINITSKGDTTLKGATATANTINTDVGGKLAIESLQDTSQFDSVQTNAGVRVQVAIGNAWSASGNLSQQKGSGTYAGVGQQSGLFAGDGGYHVKADTIDLKGGAIASTNAGASELTTNKLTTSDIENKMKYSASNVSMAGSVGGGSGAGDKDAEGNTKPKDQRQTFGTAKGGNVTPGLPMVQKGSDSSTTYATVTDGKITIGGVTTNSVKDLGINTDISKANTVLDKLPDMQKLLKDQQAMSAAAGTVIATAKQFAGDIADDARKTEAKAQEILKNSNSTAEQKAEAEKTIDAAKQVQAEWGVGGEKSRALNVVTGILVGSVAGQGGTQIVANAAAPYAAAEIGDYFKTKGNENQTLQDLSHAVLGAALAVANNSSAVGGALAGGGGELAAQVLTKELYPQAFDAYGNLQRDKLTPEQTNIISALSSAIGALMSGAVGGSAFDAAIGGQVATNAVENNQLSYQQKREKIAAMLKQMDECKKNPSGCPKEDTSWAGWWAAQKKYAVDNPMSLLNPDNSTPGGWLGSFVSGVGRNAYQAVVDGIPDALLFLAEAGRQSHNVEWVNGQWGNGKVPEEKPNSKIGQFLTDNKTSPGEKAKILVLGPAQVVGDTLNGDPTAASEVFTAWAGGKIFRLAPEAGINPPGRIHILEGAIPDANELRAGLGVAGEGYDVIYLPELNCKGIQGERTADMLVGKIGKIDVYTPETDTVTKLLRNLERKNNQAIGALIQTDLPALEIANRAWGKPQLRNFQTIFVQDSKGNITKFVRPKGN